MRTILKLFTHFLIAFLMGAFLAILLTVLMEISAEAKTLVLNQTRTIEITQPITGESMQQPYSDMESLLQSRGPIYIILDSPGGSVVAGTKFIQLMHRAKERRKHVVCVVTNQAMSMAFGILSQCAKRYAFESSFMLWHKVRQMAMFIEITRHRGRVWEHQIGILDDYMDAMIFKTLKITKKYFDFASHNNIVHTGKHIKKISPDFLTIIDDYRFKKGGK